RLQPTMKNGAFVCSCFIPVTLPYTATSRGFRSGSASHGKYYQLVPGGQCGCVGMGASRSVRTDGRASSHHVLCRCESFAALEDHCSRQQRYEERHEQHHQEDQRIGVVVSEND